MGWENPTERKRTAASRALSGGARQEIASIDCIAMDWESLDAERSFKMFF